MKINVKEKSVFGDILSERCKAVRKQLKPKYEQLRQEYEDNLSRMKPLNIKFGFRMTQHIYAALSTYPLMSIVEASNISALDLQFIYGEYMDFIAEYSLLEVVSTKQLFAAFMRITVAQFNALMKSEDKDMAAIANYINDNITGLAFASAETGNGNSTATIKRAKIKDDGQGLIETSEDYANKIAERVVDAQLLFARAQKLLGK